MDGNSYIYRAFYAIRGLSTSRGFPTNAVYGFANMLMKVVGEKKPDYIAVCFDPKGPTTRHHVFKEYKAKRPPMPDSLVPQIPYIHKIVDAFGIPVLMLPGIEADDMISVVAREASAAGLSVTIVTGDMGMRMLSIRVFVQRLDPHVSVGWNLDFVASQRELIAIMLNRDGRRCCPKDTLVLQHNAQELPGGL
ncbi:MAG: PIN domain-containing protein [Nitrospirota bacterium]